jgi:hypothetical protein
VSFDQKFRADITEMEVVSFEGAFDRHVRPVREMSTRLDSAPDVFWLDDLATGHRPVIPAS